MLGWANCKLYRLMKKIQERVDQWIGSFKQGYFSPAEIMLRLTEEVGELAREVNHNFGPKKKKVTEDEGEIALEMADVIFTIACLANSMGVDLDKAFGRMMEKMEKRDAKRWDKK